MPLPVGPFYAVSGILATPIFAQTIIRGHTLESNGTLKTLLNIMHWKAVAGVAGGDPAQLAGDLQAQIEGLYVACCSADYTLDSFDAQYIDDPLSVPSVLASGAVGTVATDRAASFNAVVIRKKSTVPSRSYNGSMHCGAVPESFTTKDLLNGTGTTAYNPLVAAFQTMVASGISDGTQPFFPIVLSSLLSDRTVTPSVFWGASVQTFSLNTTLGTMKHRKTKPV